MKQKIEIDVPYGKEAVWENGKVVFKEIPLPKTWNDFCRDYPIEEIDWVINYDSSISPIGGGMRSEFKDRFRFSSKEAAEAHLALVQLHLLRDCYRRGWVRNRDDYDQDNWCIKYVCEIGFHVSCYPYEINFLSFQTPELAEEFLNNFHDLIEQAGDLI